MCLSHHHSCSQVFVCAKCNRYANQWQIIGLHATLAQNIRIESNSEGFWWSLMIMLYGYVLCTCAQNMTTLFRNPEHHVLFTSKSTNCTQYELSTEHIAHDLHVSRIESNTHSIHIVYAMQKRANRKKWSEICAHLCGGLSHLINSSRNTHVWVTNEIHNTGETNIMYGRLHSSATSTTETGNGTQHKCFIINV